MYKLWAKDGSLGLNQMAELFNQSISVDCKLYAEDILGSIAHAKMLARQGIISQPEFLKLEQALLTIKQEIEEGELQISSQAEDIHSWLEFELTDRLGDLGKKLHTARSRNDQVAVDLRLYLKTRVGEISELLVKLIEQIIRQARENVDTVMPGYTHLQRAQPVTLGHHLLAYGMMFERDLSRLDDALARLDRCPLGAGALAGTSFNLDRDFVAQDLGFAGICENSLDAVSDRDYCLELGSGLAIIMMHLSRFCEELIIWSSLEFNFIKMDSSFATGSSIMPQKQNPDIAELIRGKTGRVYGNLFNLLTMLKALPLAYNKDMQEDKEAIFDSIETVSSCLAVFTPMLDSLKLNRERMLEASKKGFINSTDLADYLVKKGLPFRTAYQIVGRVINLCLAQECTLEDLSLAEYKSLSGLFEADLYEAIDLLECINRRSIAGGPAREALDRQVNYLRGRLDSREG